MAQSPNDSPTPTLGHVDQIREIIVGEQIREFNKQLEDLEVRMSGRFEALQKQLEGDHQKEVDTLTKQIDKLQTALREERSERVQAAKTAAKELEKQIQDLESDRSKGIEERRRELSDLQSSLRAEFKALDERVETQGRSLSAAVKDRTGSLERAKLDRTSLAELLAGMSDQLRENGDS